MYKMEHISYILYDYMTIQILLNMAHLILVVDKWD